MNYPSVSDYVNALLDSEHTLPELSNLTPVLDTSSAPIMFLGNFSVVFKMKDGEGNRYALKCFLRDMPNRQENYRLIADELEYISSSFLTSVRFIDEGITVNSSSDDEFIYPVLLMEWVEGVTLHSYIRMHLTDKNALAILPYQFGRLAAWLLSQPFAHGDLKPDNVLVKPDGTLCLVDYDAMFVAAMKGQESAELSSPNFRHPLRTAQQFNEHIDDFSLASIALALKAIALDPYLYQLESANDSLLFSSKDYSNIGESGVFQQLSSLLTDSELGALYGLFFIAYAKQELSSVSHRLFLLEKPALARKNSITPIRKLSSSRNLTFTVNGVSFDMISVEGGSFRMGSPEEAEGVADDEKPAHMVTLDSYAIGKYVVTQSLWQAVMGKNPSSNKGDNNPVEMVSWYSCQLFIERLNALTGKKFSLPT
ncbi:MAG: protein kinase domain-containing protein, partial [Phocaeicola sp.]